MGMTCTHSQSEVSLTSVLIYIVKSSAGWVVNSSAVMVAVTAAVVVVVVVVVVEVVIVVVFVSQVRQLAHDRNTCYETWGFVIDFLTNHFVFPWTVCDPTTCGEYIILSRYIYNWIWPHTFAGHTCESPSESPYPQCQQWWANGAQGQRPPPRIRTIHTNHKHARPLPYLLRRLQSHFSTLLYAVFSRIYFVKYEDEISTSTTHIIISLLEPTL